jgi:hypothetical protein
MLTKCRCKLTTNCYEVEAAYQIKIHSTFQLELEFQYNFLEDFSHLDQIVKIDSLALTLYVRFY